MTNHSQHLLTSAICGEMCFQWGSIQHGRKVYIINLLTTFRMTYLRLLFYLKEQSVWKKIAVKYNEKKLCILCCYVYFIHTLHAISLAHYPHLVSLPPHTHISTMQWSLADCDRTNSWPTPLTWQNVTFMRTWPISSGTVVVDGKFTVNESFRDAAKRAPVCWGGYFLGSRMSDPWSFARSPLDNMSSIYSPVITSGDPPPWASHLFLVSLPLVCFQLCS